MGTSDITDFIGWLIGLIATSFIAIALGIINIIRSSKMFPKELRGVDLENRSKELTLANQYDAIATRAVDKSMVIQIKLEKLEFEIYQLTSIIEGLKNQINEQEIIIKEQSGIINRQSERITTQETKATVIACELEDYKAYTNILINQLKEKQIIPAEMIFLSKKEDEKNVVLETQKKIPNKTKRVKK